MALRTTLDTALEARPDPPSRVEVVVESYRWQTREPGESDGVPEPKDGLGAAASTGNPSAAVATLAFLGLWQAGKWAAERDKTPEQLALDREERRLQVGANVWLRATVRLTGPDGRTRTVPVAVRGFGEKAENSRYWGDALRDAAQQVADQLGERVRTATPDPP